MHPSIRHFPSSHFYQHVLCDSESVRLSMRRAPGAYGGPPGALGLFGDSGRETLRRLSLSDDCLSRVRLAPLIFFNLSGSSESHEGGGGRSLANQLEADAVAKLVAALNLAQLRYRRAEAAAAAATRQAYATIGGGGGGGGLNANGVGDGSGGEGGGESARDGVSNGAVSSTDPEQPIGVLEAWVGTPPTPPGVTPGSVWQPGLRDQLVVLTPYAAQVRALEGALMRTLRRAVGGSVPTHKVPTPPLPAISSVDNFQGQV